MQVEVQDLGVGVVQQAPKPIGGAVKARKVSIVHGRIVMAKDVHVLLGAVAQVPTMALTSRRRSGAAHIGACVDAVQLAPIEQGRTSIFQARADHLGRGMDPVEWQRKGGVAASPQKLRAMARRTEAAAMRDGGNQHRSSRVTRVKWATGRGKAFRVPARRLIEYGFCKGVQGPSSGVEFAPVCTPVRCPRCRNENFVCEIGV